MPTSADVLVDTSAAVALSVESHRFHDLARRALSGRRLGLSGHAAFETFSVLTRLPAPDRRTPATVARLLDANFPATVYLSRGGARRLANRLDGLGVAGGSVYDALVGAAAVEAALGLASFDRRAAETYRAVGADVEWIEEAA